MAKGKLNANSIEAAKTPDMLPDGDGLYLQVTRNARTGAIRKSWVYRYRSGGRTRDMGLGPLSAVPLASARKAAQAARECRGAGIDPIDHRDQVQREQVLAAERTKTFKDVAQEFIATKRASWRNPKHAAQWPSTLEKYAYPILGDLPVDEVSAAAIKKVLDPIWLIKSETARRVRARIERVLDYARAMGLRSGENPARWRDHASIWLSSASQQLPVKHHAALAYRDLPAFVRKLRAQAGMAAKALEFSILTAARTGEVVGAKWSEIDLDNKLWTIPAERMKGHRQHRVPLSRSAATLVRDLQIQKGANDHVFGAPANKKPMSNMAMLSLIGRMGLKGQVTTHGFRSTFRDWAAEQTEFDPAVAEAALAHIAPSKVERAYLRADRLEQRKELMRLWDEFAFPQKMEFDLARKSKRRLQL